MKIFKKLSAAAAALAAVLVMSVNVSAEKVVGFDYAPAGGNFVYYDFTAEDGAAGTLKFTKDGNGDLYFSSYEIDAPAPESPVDFPEFKEPDKGYRQFGGNDDFFSYFEEVRESSENGLFEAIVVKFDLSFDPPLSDGTFSMDCAKYYIADLESKTVRYAGSYCLSEAIVPETEEAYNVCERRAEDGAKFYLYFNKKSGGYSGCEAETVYFDYAVDNINGTVTLLDVDTGYKLYSDPDDIPLGDNDILVEVDFEQEAEVSGRILCVVSGKRFYVVTVDGINSTVRYMGHSAEYSYREYGNSAIDPNSDLSDGETASPDTGNGNSFFAVMLAAAGMAFLAKYAKK